MAEDGLEGDFEVIERQAEEAKEQFLAYVPRNYQLQVLAQARATNTIAFLDTGTGKTYIAIMLLKECSGKAAFLAPTRALVLQQGIVARKMGLNAGIYQGKKYDFVTNLHWKKKLEKHSVFFFTPQLFLNNLRFGFFNISDFALLIFDECHWCYGGHPYSNIMKEFVYCLPLKPKIFGMTASPVTSKQTSRLELKEKIEDLADALECTFAPVDRSSVDMIANKPQVQVDRFTELQSDIDISIEVLHPVQDTVLSDGEHEEFEEVLSALSRDCKAIYDLLGRYALSMYLQDMANMVQSRELKKTLVRMGTVDKDPTLVSSRYKKLKAIIFSHFSKTHDHKGKAIVFTERRVVAYYLSRLLGEDPLFRSKELKPRALVGVNANGKYDVTRMTDREQDFALVSFRSNLANILVATSVVEEGLDIPSCDLVVRYESFSNNLRSYVQSRGRARQIDSKFYLLVDDKNDQTDTQIISQFDQAIEFLKVLADSGVSPRLTQKPELESFSCEQTGAKISVNWSRLYLDELCLTLKTDAFSEKSAKYASEFYPARTCPLTDIGGWENSGHLGIVKVPNELHIPETFSSRLYQAQDDAKAGAALQVLKLMYERKLLNSNLRAVWLTSSDFERELIPISTVSMEIFGPRKGPTIKLGKKLVTSLPQDSPLDTAINMPNSPAYLYTLKIHPSYPDFENYSLAILTPFPLNTDPFRFYPGNLTKNKTMPICGDHGKQEGWGEDYCPSCNGFAFWALPKMAENRVFEAEELAKFKGFHSLLMASLGGKLGDFLSSLQEKKLNLGEIAGGSWDNFTTSLLCIPWNNSSDSIDWDIVNGSLSYIQARLRGDPMESISSECGFTDYIWKVVQSKEKNHLYAVTEISPDGLSTVIEKKGKRTTLREYIQSKGKEVAEQSVLMVKNIGKFRNANWLLAGKRLVSILPMLAQQLAPFPFPVSIVQFGRIFPTLLCQLQWKYIYGNISAEYGISLPLVQAALTCPSAHEETDYQRLETLGDSVLKYRATRFFFLSQPDSHEGVITKLRENHSSNAFLYNISVKKELYRYLQVLPFSLKNWVPPGIGALYLSSIPQDYSDEEELAMRGPNAEQYEHDQFCYEDRAESQAKLYLNPWQKVADISHKQLADIVEALIGAAYLSGGISLSEEVIRKLDVLPPGKKLVRELKATRDFTLLEEKLGIRVKNAGWYVEAFIHDSANEQRSYQRLECLGDALLDLISVEYFYKKYPEASPGVLSKLKSQMNNTLQQACFTVQLDLIPYIQFNSQDIAAALLPIQSARETFMANPKELNIIPEKTLKLLADIFEALFGAIVMDYDLDTAKEVYFRVAGDTLTSTASPETISEHPHTDFFEWAQSKGLKNLKIIRTGEKVAYRNVENFCVEVYYENRIVGKYVSRSKREASERACQLARQKIDREMLPPAAPDPVV